MLFGKDERVLIWDMYNEVGNSGHLNNSYPLMNKIFGWAREIDIIQPITSGFWNGGSEYASINSFILSNSDINTFHAYCDVSCTKNAIKANKGNFYFKFSPWKTIILFRIYGKRYRIIIYYSFTCI